MQLIVLTSDIQTRKTAAVLQGSGWAWFETILDFIFFGIVLVMSVRCSRRQLSLDHSVDDLIDQIA
ncbi:MAG TPA: hypothetical protein VFR51_07760 [Pyrinomonadaceae bacterium]|nr:hypothetical protein [Pyrinomonadaceae bacterium]